MYHQVLYSNQFLHRDLLSAILLVEKLRGLAQQLVRSAEEERKRLARDLHDTLGQSVAYLRLRLEHLLLSSDPAHQIGEIRQANCLCTDSDTES